MVKDITEKWVNTVEDITEKWTKLKNNIGTTNEILTFLEYPTTHVSVLNETPVMKEYKIEHVVDGIYCDRTIKFDGSVVYVDQIWDFDKSGYMAWKWGWIRRELDNHIKTQEKAQKRAEKIKKYGDFGLRLKCAFADMVLGRGAKA